MQIAYSMIGRAVFMAQTFETVLISIFEAFKMQTFPGYLDKTKGYIEAGAFKVPISNVVNILAQKQSIAPDLEKRLTEYVDSRNLLIHRWVQLHGWPDENDVTGFGPIIDLAQKVESEARALTLQFVEYVLKYNNTPDAQAKMAAIFRQAHLE